MFLPIHLHVVGDPGCLHISKNQISWIFLVVADSIWEPHTEGALWETLLIDQKEINFTYKHGD